MQSKKKPAKPYPHFPLFAHASGKWAKKIGGKIEYFGRWEDPLGALAEFKRLYADGGGGPTTKTYLCLYDGLNEFLVAKEDSKTAGSLSRESFRDYKQTCKSLIRHFGEDADINAFSPSDFAWYKRERSKQLNLVSMGNEIQRVRTAFKWLRRSKLIDDEPEYGPDFRKPTALQIRRHKRHLGSKCYTPRQVHQLLDECGVHLRAMAFLGLNCGYGPTDLALLEQQVFETGKESGFIDYPRRKTEIARCAWLWPETIDAVDRSIERRTDPNEECQDLLFVYRDGGSWKRNAVPISKRFADARKWTGMRTGDFYWFRHTFETISGAAKDQVATDLVMGHVDPSMSENYRHHIGEDRIKAVCQHVRSWLFESQNC